MAPHISASAIEHPANALNVVYAYQKIVMLTECFVIHNKLEKVTEYFSFLSIGVPLF